MTSQLTTPETIAAEIQTVRSVAQLAESAQIMLNDTGWDSRVYLFDIDGIGHVMKFPRSEKIRGRYAAQIEAMRLAHSVATGVEIPELLWQHPDNNYFGYRAVTGLTLSKAIKTMDDATKNAVGATLGAFLAQFHGLELESARDMRPLQEIGQIQNWYSKGEIARSGLLTNDELAKLDDMVMKVWPERLLDFDSSIALCHGDFHFNNIFYDNGRLGIIDFGDVCNADHSKDFNDFDDEVILAAALRAYEQEGGDLDDAMKEKIALRSDMIRVITLTAQIVKGETAKLESSAAMLVVSLR